MHWRAAQRRYQTPLDITITKIWLAMALLCISLLLPTVVALA